MSAATEMVIEKSAAKEVSDRMRGSLMSKILRLRVTHVEPVFVYLTDTRIVGNGLDRFNKMEQKGLWQFIW